MFCPVARAVSPTPDGCYPNFTTAEGCDALNFLTTGAGNTALGWRSLFLNTEGSFNTGVGAGALALNIGDSNTAVGAAALLLNTIGDQNTAVGTNALVFNESGDGNTAIGNESLKSNTTGGGNTATGFQALFSNTTGGFNTANGIVALYNNTVGNANTASGFNALFHNTEGSQNTANGVNALFGNTNGHNNTATGYQALSSNTIGQNNTANGAFALSDNTEGNENTATGIVALQNNTTGFANTAVGSSALSDNTTGQRNTAVGFQAGLNITGSGNVCIGAGADGPPGVDDTTWIKNVYPSVATARAVYVNSDGKVGTLSSSRRYKDEIRPMAKASEVILSLRPVSFRYKKKIDPTRSLSFGLIAEEVAQVDPNLVTPDQDGQPQTVRYEAVNAMLLNEFLKEHRKNGVRQSKIEEQDLAISQLKSALAQQQKRFESKLAHQEHQIAALVATLQRLAAEVKLTKAESRTVVEK